MIEEVNMNKIGVGQSSAIYTHTKKGGTYIIASGLAIPAGDIKHLNKPLVVYQNSEGRVFVRSYESFLESFTLIA